MAAVGMGKLGLGAAGVTAIVALMAGCASSSSATKTAAGNAASSSSATKAAAGRATSSLKGQVDIHRHGARRRVRSHGVRTRRGHCCPPDLYRWLSGHLAGRDGQRHPNGS